MNNKNKIKVTFCGMSAKDVTNSMYLIEYSDKKFLLDCGLFQSSSPNLLKTYQINSRNYKIPFKDLNAIVISHAHVDHCGLVPYAYSKGATCPCYVPKNCAQIIKIMGEDSIKIFSSDAEKTERRFKAKISPLYTNEDLQTALSHIVELDFHKKVNISDDATIELFNSGHIVNAAQIKFEFTIDNVVKSLGYTGDIGSSIKNEYVKDYEPLPYCDIMIGESTYSGDNRSHSEKDRANDIAKIKTAIEQCCLENCNKVVFGVFSLGRLQEILTELYKIYGEDENFAIPILVDAPLGIKISNIYEFVIEKNVDLWNKVKMWKNIVWINEYETSQYYQKLNTPQIILSTSNMLSAGRILSWLKSILPHKNNRVMFCGYTGAEDSLAWKIKNNKNYVTIDGCRVSNKAGITCLTSFSSHASKYELLQRYSDMNYHRLYLVHGGYSDKIKFAEELRNSISKKNKSSKICTPTFGDKILF